ncbi:MAG TPA: ATP-binding protein, partial [Thermoanaerobaculia bacterium]|nr:ATP-binding protein [Thermoanaerobaculia bacterium]
TLSKFSDRFAHPDPSAKGLEGWRERVLFGFLWGVTGIGLVAYVLSVRMALRSNAWGIIGYYTVAYGILVVTTILPGLRFTTRAWISLSVLLVVGIGQLWVGGLIGSGRVYLFGFAILATLLRGWKGAVVALIVLLGTMVTFSALVAAGHLHFIFPQGEASPRVWIMLSATFLFLCGGTVAAVALLVRGLQESLVEERRLVAQLQEGQALLEKRVAERTEELHSSNQELAQAYEALQKGQQQLIAAEKMASLGRLTAGITHEINTPLAAVRAALSESGKLVTEYESSLEDAAVTPEDHRGIARDLKRAVELAAKAAGKAADFVRSVKAQTRDLAPQARERFNAVPVVRDALLLLGYSLRQTNCEARLDCPDETVELEGSPGRLAQIVTNVVTNAVDASRANGGGLIALALGSRDGEVELTVTDRGCGMAPDVLSRIFDPLFSTKPFGEGTGLGLTLVRDIVATDFRGTIDVQSSPGEGSTFRFLFPVAEVEAVTRGS